MGKHTKRRYEQYLNDLNPDYESDLWIIAGKRRYLRFKYGQQLRKHDPIAFEVGYNDDFRIDKSLIS